MKDDIKLVTLRTFDTSVEAHILKTRLESDAIECYLFDENINSLNLIYNIAVGGIKLKIKSTDLDRAEEIIKQIEETAYTDEDNATIICPKCTSSDLYSGIRTIKGVRGFLSALISFSIMVFPPYCKTVHKCKSCGYEFEYKNANK